jgi:alanyl-tRNA synthetase
MTEALYFQDPLTLIFDATIQQVTPDDHGVWVMLDRTYFYPTGGGQPHDTGTINGRPVLDVRKSKETADAIEHLVQGELTPGAADCRINQGRRWRLMQAHTGQHILSAAFFHALDAKTVSVSMHADSASTVDIDLSDLVPEQIEHVEDLSNQIVMENRPVRSAFVVPDDPRLEILRRPVKFDKVSGDVRLVEIEDFDHVACAGTHLPVTGMLGLLKLLKVENYKGGSRVYFAAGYHLLDTLREHQTILDALSDQLSSGLPDLPDRVQKLQRENIDLNKTVEDQREALLIVEKNTLLEKADLVGETRLVKALFDGRDADEARKLALLIAEEPQVITVLALAQDSDLIVIVTASEGEEAAAGDVLRALINPFEGRGGGNPTYAQGVCKGLIEQPGALDRLMDAIPETVQDQL